MTKPQRWIITTSGDRPVRQIAKDLESKGFVSEHVLEEIGSITGSASASVVAQLRKVRGVSDVSPDSVVDVGPPDSDDPC